MKFEVRIPTEGYVTYVIEADSEAEAREMTFDGYGDLTDSYWEHADTDYNPVEVIVLEDV